MRTRLTESMHTSQGADVNHRNERDNVALHQALFASNLGVAELLLQRGADPHVVTKSGFGVMAIADMAVRTEEAKALLQRYM